MRFPFLSLLGLALFLPACGSSDGGDDTKPGNTPEEQDTTLHTYEADNPLISVVGRINRSYPKFPRFSSPAVTVRVRFRGVGIAVRFEDQFAYGTNKNYFDAVLDGTEVTKIIPEMGVARYEIATGLEYGEHELSFVKRTEASIGYTDFEGIEVQGVLLEPPTRERKVEIIGDSISCGAGSELSGTPAQQAAQCMEDVWGVPYNNARLAFGSVVAESLGADYQVTAVSGIGLVRNYSDMYDARPMPEVYDSEFLQVMGSRAYDHELFHPDAILIVLGTNDFSPGDNPPEDPRPSMVVSDYVDAYVAFVDKLLETHPNAQVFALGSPMLTNGWPNATDTFRDDLEAALTAVEQHYVSAGETRVHKFLIPKVPGAGCGTHPSVAEHAGTAALVEPFVRETLGW